MYRSSSDSLDDFQVGDHVSYPTDNRRFNAFSRISEEMAKGMAKLAGYGGKHEFYNKIGVVVAVDNYWGKVVLVYQHDFNYYLIVGQELAQ